MRSRTATLAAALALALAGPLAFAPAQAGDGSPAATRATLAIPASGVIGVEEAHLSPEFWVARMQAPDAVLMGPDAIAAQNAELLQVDDSMHDLRALPATLEAAQVRRWIGDLSQRPERPRYDVDGEPVPRETLDALVANLALDAIPAAQATRFGMVLRRAALRTFPTSLRVFSNAGETDIDRFQESALFPGTPVAIVHASADDQWRFVVAPRYAAWIQADAVAEGPRDAVLGYAGRVPYRIVTGAEELPSDGRPSVATRTRCAGSSTRTGSGACPRRAVAAIATAPIFPATRKSKNYSCQTNTITHNNSTKRSIANVTPTQPAGLRTLVFKR